MKRSLITTTLAAATLLVMFAAPAGAVGPWSSAAGAVEWTARANTSNPITGIESAFDVYESPRGDGGYYASEREGLGSFLLDVACVEVDGNEAWFAGTVIWETGDYVELGDVYSYWVQDNGTPGTTGPDKIGGIGYGAESAACEQLGDFTGSGVVTAGDLTVDD